MSPLPRLLRPALGALALALGTWAALVWMTGGGTITLGALRLSSRAASRPALAALLCAALWARLTTAAERRQAVAAVAARVERASTGLALLLALAGVGVSTIFGTHVAGGSDASGYGSQSRLWAAGRHTLPVAQLSDAPWPDRGWLVAPLGYTPSQTPDRLAPTYAPGLPWLMALGGRVAGEPGRYVWTPLAVGLLVWGTFVWTRREAPAAVALAAAALTGTSAAVVFAAMQAMSDLPGAALWLLALLGLTSAERPPRMLGAAAAALAVAVRPNLAPMAALVWVTMAVDLRERSRASAVRPLVFGLALALPAAAIAVINQRLFGSPFLSGYGAPGTLFTLDQVPPNLAAIWRWLGETRAYWLAVGLPALVWRLRGSGGGRWWPALALVGGVVASYTLYFVFVEWWYLRFYLPAFPFLAAAVAIAAWRLVARASATLAPIAVLAAAVVMGHQGVTIARDAGAFGLWRAEWRYWAVAQWTRDHAPAQAVLLSVQHSGALAADAGRPIARWDQLAPEALDAFVARQRADGRTAWLVVDDWEEAGFRARFAPASPRGRLDWAPIAEARVDALRVRVYDLSTPDRAVAPALIPVVTGGPWPWRRGPARAPQ